MMDVNDLISVAVQLFNEKKYAEAIEKLHQVWDGITDKSTQISEQIGIKSLLGCCYLEQARIIKNTDKADKLFGKAVKHYRKWLQLAKQLTDEQDGIQQQINAQSRLGICYFEQAKRIEDVELFEQAIEYNKKWLLLTDHLKDGRPRIQQQIDAQFWLANCYLEQAMETKGIDKADDLFKKAGKHYLNSLQLVKKLEKNDPYSPKLPTAQFSLVYCRFEQAKRTKNLDTAGKLFKKAALHCRKWLSLLVKQSANGQSDNILKKREHIWQQISARYWLGRCFFEQARTTKGKTEYFTEAVKFFNEALEQIPNLSKELRRKKEIPLCFPEDKGRKARLELMEKKIHHYLGDIDYLINKYLDSYFERKKQEIQESLFKGKTSQLQDAVSTVLAVLHITPIELGFTPMAHYTSPHVCHILFGIGGNETAKPMRLGSSTYMNDPSEGRGLLDLLNQQDLELENKADGASHNAFFTCFSSRVNDLNQFRLYGKEDGVEASGCCLVFNKNGDWLKEVDVSVPFRSLSQKSGQDSDGLLETGFSGDEYEKLPLYQVAYIAYKDEYIADKKCGIWFPSQKEPKFGIRLKPVGNEDWHQIRLGKLKEALEELIRFFEDKSAVSDDDKEALEYIRYLFKDFALRDEEEFRLLVIKPIDSEEIEYCEKTQSVYIPYADIRNLADEVILGTNYEKTGNQRKAEVFRYQMKQKCPDVKVSRSTLPINPPNKLNHPNK